MKLNSQNELGTLKMTVNVLNDKAACPSLKWFYGLPEDRREKAIKASFMHRLAVDEAFPVAEATALCGPQRTHPH